MCILSLNSISANYIHRSSTSSHTSQESGNSVIILQIGLASVCKQGGREGEILAGNTSLISVNRIVLSVSISYASENRRFD